MIRRLLLASLFIFGNVNADTFDELLKNVKQETRQELEESKSRIADFAREKEKQASELAAAKETLARLIAESEKLKTDLDNNEQALAETEEELQRKTGDLGELFGAIRQVAGELKADFEHSLITAQYPDRLEQLQVLAQSKALPNVQELESLWYMMLQEMGETAKTRRFSSAVIQKDGSTIEQDVIRLGAYTAIGNSEFLQYNPETATLEQLQKQPPLRYSITAKNYDTAGAENLVKVSVDPSRGQLLTLLTLKPELWERIQQGGVIGYIILALGAIGILVAVIRYIYLTILSSKISRQLKKLNTPSKTNPLGRLALVYQEAKNKSLEEREVIMEEAMLKEVPSVEKYNGFLKLLAAVAPLLGLLGTVIGMIITFQTITLFGTSDPKLMAGGISTALVTTVLGLSVAVPLLFAHTLIHSKSRKIVDIIEHQAVGLIARET